MSLIVASFRRSLCLSVVALLPAGLHAQGPVIEITHVPAYGGFENLRGRVLNADPADYHVAAYLFLEGLGWWVKPFAIPPCTPIGPDGRFEVDVTTGGVDELAHRYAVFLLPAGDPCPGADRSEFLPHIPGPSAFAERTPYLLQFSGATWVRRPSPYFGGPGSNCFSPDHASVDDLGQLHLKLASVSSLGHCGGEVWHTRSLGYGEYRIHTVGRLDTLDPAAVLGMFTWDPDAGPSHRELDVELSRWCNAADPDNAQFVVAPFDQAGHRVRFPIGDATEHTFVMNWEPAVATFSAYGGHHWGVPPPEGLIFRHVFTQGVPTPGQERFRFNLWNACVSAQPQEVVVRHFRHTPLSDCSVQLNRSSYKDGDSVVVSRLRIANNSTITLPVELKIWLGVPGLTPVSLVNTGADGSLKLPVGFEFDPDPYTLFQVLPAHPRGAYELGCRTLHPVTGGLMAEGVGSFWIE